MTGTVPSSGVVLETTGTGAAVLEGGGAGVAAALEGAGPAGTVLDDDDDDVVAGATGVALVDALELAPFQDGLDPREPEQAAIVPRSKSAGTRTEIRRCASVISRSVSTRRATGDGRCDRRLCPLGSSR
jgi:hypothetical protein